MIITPGRGNATKIKKCVMCADDAGNTRASESLYLNPNNPQRPAHSVPDTLLPPCSDQYIPLPPYSIERIPSPPEKVDIRSGEERGRR